MFEKDIEAYIKDWKKENLDDYTRQLIGVTKFDLWYGPLNCQELKEEEGFDYPGFSKACDMISEAFSDLGDLFVDEMGFVCDSEPQFEDDDHIDYWRYDRRHVLRLAVSKELSEYI